MHSSLALCNKASLRVDNRGVLSLQFIVPQSDQHTVFIEFHVSFKIWGVVGRKFF